MKKRLVVGIFHPTLNTCGGAEWVAINVMNIIKNEGHQIAVLTNEKISKSRILRIFGCEAKFDVDVVFPFEFFPSTDYHNVYTDAIRTLLLKSKCDVLIDTQSNAILPGADITYIHYPLLGRLEGLNKIRLTYYTLYQSYERRHGRDHKRLILSNSAYTANAIRKIFGAEARVLYPPISKTCYLNNNLEYKEDIVISVSRIEPGKMQVIIPQIAKLTNEKIRFLIIGSKSSQSTLSQILEEIKRNKLSDRVKVLTEVSRKELLCILQKSKVFLHPAQGEHFGIAIAEAMASGCIPIVHNSGGPREFVPEYFRFDTLEEAAKIIEKAVFEWSPHQARDFIRIAHSFSEEKFAWNFLKIFNSYLTDRFIDHNKN